jgi:hypothetical protein
MAAAAAAAAAVAALATLGPGGPVPIRPYALTPALLDGRHLDYSVLPDVKLHYKAIKPLTTKFDLTPGNMVEFCNDLMTRAKDVNWLMTLTVPVGNVTYNLIEQYGSVTLEEVRAYAATYVGTPTRHAQNSNQIYACLSESLTSEAKNKVVLEKASYTVNGNLCGLLYFNVIVGLAHIDTRATVAVLRTRLSSLDIKIVKLQDKIVELNQFVKTQTSGLEARGEQTSDLLVNLFKAYKACGDAKFVRWVSHKEDSYFEGSLAITPIKIISWADNKYKTQLEAG